MTTSQNLALTQARLFFCSKTKSGRAKKKKLKKGEREREKKKKWSRSRDNRTFFQTPIALECPDLAVLIVDSFVFFLDQGP